MIKQIKDILSNCELLKDLSVCVSPHQANSTGLIPSGERIIKKYTDGKEVRELQVELLYKALYSPNGDCLLDADLFFESVIKDTEKLFTSRNIAENYGVISFSAGTYTIKHTSPSSITYSLLLTFNYLKERK